MRESRRYILHVDMDAFFASIEQLDQPELRGKPVIVGSPPDKRGVVSTCSYEARRYGVRSAMPSRTAYMMCPMGVFVPVRMARYQAVSKQVFEVMAEFSPFVEPLSVDEAFLDVTGSHHLFGGPEATAYRLKERIREATGGLTASVGLAPNKFLAKLSSDMNKPDGVTVTPSDPAAILAFLAPLPVRRIWGIGAKTEERLRLRGITTVAHLQGLGEADLRRLVGDKGAARLWQLCRGLDTRPVEPRGEEKSISSEHTYGEDCRDWLTIERTLLAEAATVGVRLREAELWAKTAHLKLRWDTFETLSRQMPFARPTHTERDLRDAALAMMERLKTDRAVRLIGFGVSGFVDAASGEEHGATAEEDAEHGGSGAAAGKAKPAEAWQPDLFETLAAGGAPGAGAAAASADGGEAAGAAGDGGGDDGPPGPRQEPPQEERESRLDSALDRIRTQFGKGSIRRGW